MKPAFSPALDPRFVLSLIVASWAWPIRAEEPLHEQIDRLIAAGDPEFERKAAPLASDAEFLRRVYLDLVGTIPSAEEARAFLADSSPDKRARLIDDLLARPEHARHLQHVFDALWLERRPDRGVPRGQWQQYLFEAFRSNKPWDQLVRELLAPDLKDPKIQAAAKFYLDRDAEPHQMTSDVSRLFLGMNLQCAQCHDHPVVDDYTQDSYYGIYAFLSRSYVHRPRGSNSSMLAEKAEGEVTYQSVFDPKKVTKSAGPRLPGGELLKEPKFEKGQEYEPAKGNAAPVPKFSRREQLAVLLASRDNAAFKRASANRFWALLMGRGLVHPVDLDHSNNPASHPELLDLLANRFADIRFDIRAFLRELALSRTYQRSSELPVGVDESARETFAVANLKPLSPEQLAFAVMQATGWTDVERKSAKDPNVLYGRLAANMAPFVAAFGTRPGQPIDGSYEATLDQALFVAHGKLLATWLAPHPGGNLTFRLGQRTDPREVAEELFLSVLTRWPSDEERKEVVQYLQDRSGDRVAALQELTWALLASTEFRFNH
ncbi:MAG: DUF1549 and DUF1553 domain-containing protein [Gemmataceae bacterium]|nr:DUF1549 and DUF1553 domain-containing protein [Gemmataceae bacterium]MDW8264113.1 DUF1549 domain-containing protein [Gemmataceae bacterium]